MMVLRFANLAFQAFWNRQYISSVTVVFKEPFGTEGRGGYFDPIGIIRDVAQNHLLQVISLIAMERPTSLDAEAIRDEKVKVLRSIEPLSLDDVVIGQYTASEDGTKPGYKDDPTVPSDSITPTFFVAALKVVNERWDGVPFFIKCGKALEERKALIRIQLRDVPGQLYPGTQRGELVMEIQPSESIFLKTTVKQPGMNMRNIYTDLDLSYRESFKNSGAGASPSASAVLPDAVSGVAERECCCCCCCSFLSSSSLAGTSGLTVVCMRAQYETLIYEVLRGSHANFVRADELEIAWAIFTPLLHALDKQRVVPIPYAYGSRGPAEAVEFAERRGYVRTHGYTWQPQNVSVYPEVLGTPAPGADARAAFQ